MMRRGRRKKYKVSAVGKLIHRKRFIDKVGLDSDITIALIDDIEQYSLFKPKVFNKKIVHVNYKILAELIGYFTYKKGFSREQAKDKVFSYFRENKIIFLSRKNTNLNEVDRLFNLLKQKRRSLGNDAGDKDLEIISIYKSHNIDLIFSRNAHHFRPFCDYLNMGFEQLIEDVDIMWNQTFGFNWKKR